MTTVVTLPPKLTADLEPAVGKTIANQLYNSPALNDDHELVVAQRMLNSAIDESPESGSTDLALSHGKTISNWLETEIERQINETGIRPEELTNTHMRLAQVLPEESMPQYSGGIPVETESDILEKETAPPGN